MLPIAAGSSAPARAGRIRGAIAGATAALLGLAGIAFGEAWIVATVVLLGPLGAFAVVSVFTGAISALIAHAYDEDEARSGPRPVVRRIRRWIDNRRASAERRGAALWRVSSWLALVALSVTAGPFVTTLAAKTRGTAGAGASGYTAAIVSSLVFSAVWVAIYSGAIAAVRRLVWG